MAHLTPADAAAVNVLIDYIAGHDDDPPAEVVRSMLQLARGAHDHLQDGWEEDGVRERWAHAFDTVQRASAGPADAAIDPAEPTNPA